MIKTLVQEFNFNKPKVKELGSYGFGSYKEGGIIRPFTKESSTGRIDKKALEYLYFNNSVIRNSIRRQVQMIGSAGYRLLYNNPKEQTTFEEFFKNIGQIGDECDFDEIYLKIPKNQFICGGGWNELIWDEEDEEIVDINSLDFKRMDYARNAKKEILIGIDQKPIGYTMKMFEGINSGQKVNVSMGDEVPENYKVFVDLGSDKIFLLPKRIALIRLEEEGDGLEFWGLLETIYRDSTRKGKLEEAGFNSAFQRWMAPLIGYIGDPTHPATPQLAAQTLENAKKMKHDLISIFPFYTKLETLKGNEMETYIEMLKSLRENEASGLQMPMPFAMSSGEATNRATLNNQQAMLEFGLNELVKLNAKLITKRIFKPIAESKGLKTWPTLVPNRVSVDEIDDRAVRFSMYVEKGLFTPDELRPSLAEAEGLILQNQKMPKIKKEEKPYEKTDIKKEKEDLYESTYEKSQARNV